MTALKPECRCVAIELPGSVPCSHGGSGWELPRLAPDPQHQYLDPATGQDTIDHAAQRAAKPSASQARAAALVQAVTACREDRLGGALAILCAAGFGVMMSKASVMSADGGSIEVDVHDLVNEDAPIGSGTGRHVAGALLTAILPMANAGALSGGKAMSRQARRAAARHLRRVK